ncbi:hypothetical protein DCAR_0519863 [Daucus carota subsp. sativus]|uniref:Uncharacterized protein n=1 Tax=Daucus carota subsp. sativus TaxID=79200 RepID=A0AAF1AYX7_DAUCS|nr:hypothetical protein DCAR_0519863 [Daucus carota subsp. sativus]
MAPSKKTKSATNRTTSNIIKALKKNKSVGAEPEKKKAVQPSPSKSSPKSVKQKAISTNLKAKISKKRKRENVVVPEKKEGLKLLKRGPVTMHWILRRKILGIKHQVCFNAKGEPYGEVASEMQSYIGVLGRTKCPIWYESWKAVPKEKKNKIWDCVQVK